MPDRDDKGVPTITDRGILTIMAVLVVIATIVGFIAGGLRIGVGVLFGGLLAFVNYFWLDRSTKAVFQPDAVTTGSFLALRYIGRYLVMGAILLAIYWTEVVPVEAVIAGLGTFALAVVVLGIASIFIKPSS